MRTTAIFMFATIATASADDTRLDDTSAYVPRLTSSATLPGATPPTAATSRSESEPLRWLVLGAALVPGEDLTRGARLEFDMFGFGALAFGASLSFYDYSGTTELLELEVASALTASLSHSYRGWHLRGFAGGGVSFSSSRLASEVTSNVMGSESTTTAVAPMFEAGLRVGRDLFGGWALAAGSTQTVTRGSAMELDTSRTTLLVGLGRRW